VIGDAPLCDGLSILNRRTGRSVEGACQRLCALVSPIICLQRCLRYLTSPGARHNVPRTPHRPSHRPHASPRAVRGRGCHRALRPQSYASVLCPHWIWRYCKMFFTESAAARGLIDVIDVIDHAWRPIDDTLDTGRTLAPDSAGAAAAAAALRCCWLHGRLGLAAGRPSRGG
jgi:hypothetical protein